MAGDPSWLRGRPVVIAVNHSNALGDIALMLTVLPQFPRFLAASSWWRHAPVRLLFRLGRVLPVHRRGDGSTGEQNGNTFAACHDALAAADHIAIFPEGRLNSGSELLPLRTGAARIALSAAADAGIPRVALVPVAVAYSDRGRLRSDVAIQFGVPIEIDEWVERVGADPVGNARQLTDLLEQRVADAFASATAEIEAIGVDPPADRHRRIAELALLAPVAAAGAAANAAAVVPIALGARIRSSRGLAGDDEGCRSHRPAPCQLAGCGSPPRQALGSGACGCAGVGRGRQRMGLARLVGPVAGPGGSRPAHGAPQRQEATRRRQRIGAEKRRRA